MDSGLQAELVHESETQRQYPRVRVPGTAKLSIGDQERSYPLRDLSAGGFSVAAGSDAFRVGDSGRGTLSFSIDHLGLSIPVRYQVRNIDRANGRIGCCFQDLGAREIASLRYLIGANLSGELIGVGDMLAAISRDNLTRQRGIAPTPAIDHGTRPRAIGLTAVIFVAGVAAFLYAAAKLYGVLFVVHASAAKVAVPSFTIPMPRDGTFFSLVPPDGEVKKGQALGTFQAAMLDVVQSDPGALHLTPAQLSELMGETLKGTISSPCNCQVHQQFALDSQFVNRNQPLMELVPQDATPYVLARFPFEDIDRLGVGRSISFHVSGDTGERSGTIHALRMLPGSGNALQAGTSTDLRGLDTPGAVSDVLVEIQPAAPLPPKLIDRPVDVALGDPRGGIDDGLRHLAGLFHSTVQTARQ